ncbi:hypothetical protein LTV02_13380 [Nocardia yamanashiensis]|uniref:hypothetical protein n=1 Tax=Nocardia yamanashiensis TaxID=209247 RepID=UPI001E51B8F9|nr:hypothetical protein [Nocardia yamanashiensis]UGT44319.1 hypothetical protein LTV02_13380 [Nocardia yamanashiensis]
MARSLGDDGVDKLRIEICELIVGDSAYEQVDWSGITVVVAFGRGTSSLWGWVYTADGGWEGNMPDSWDVLERVAELRAAMSAQGDASWKSCLLQINRSDLVLRADFDYKDEDRWNITVASLDQIAEELRPR